MVLHMHNEFFLFWKAVYSQDIMQDRKNHQKEWMQQKFKRKEVPICFFFMNFGSQTRLL